MMNNSLFHYLPLVFMVLNLVVYIVGITLGILGIQALRKYLRE